jgi:nuclear transcription factor Y gamma
MYQGKKNFTVMEQQIQEIITAFWQDQYQRVQKEPIETKNHLLPLARIKKVMKSDDDTKHMMISQEAPLLFNKACELFILEMTIRAWMHTEEHKRRTLQKSDIVGAISQSDMYDCMIY